ncbi:hypothetical protein [Desulfonatronospira sp.]|nr:hypothetical protein [Desulfonatronospira sp.]
MSASWGINAVRKNRIGRRIGRRAAGKATRRTFVAPCAGAWIETYLFIL